MRRRGAGEIFLSPAFRLTPASPERRHAHLWHLPDGTGVHAPLGELVVEAGTGRLCCHLCGRWYISLGAHVRVHGHTATTYRMLLGLCTGEPLVAADLSSRIAERQARAHQQDARVRERLALAAPLRDGGDLSARARRALQGPEPLQRVARRRSALQAGRQTMAARRGEALADRLADLGHPDLDTYLRAAYTEGASLEHLARATGLGRARLREAMLAAGIDVRPSGHNTPQGRRSRARRADRVAAARIGTDDLTGWLRARHADGWSLTRLAAEVGHSSHWVRWRLEAPDDDRAERPLQRGDQ